VARGTDKAKRRTGLNSVMVGAGKVKRDLKKKKIESRMRGVEMNYLLSVMEFYRKAMHRQVDSQSCLVISSIPFSIHLSSKSFLFRIFSVVLK